MQKTKRLLAIEKIISEEKISSQDALLKKLKGKGINCTQATLSRNLRQLGVGRIPDGKEDTNILFPENDRNSARHLIKANIVPVIRDILKQKDLLS